MMFYNQNDECFTNPPESDQSAARAGPVSTADRQRTAGPVNRSRMICGGQRNTRAETGLIQRRSTLLGQTRSFQNGFVRRVSLPSYAMIASISF